MQKKDRRLWIFYLFIFVEKLKIFNLFKRSCHIGWNAAFDAAIFPRTFTISFRSLISPRESHTPRGIARSIRSIALIADSALPIDYIVSIPAIGSVRNRRRWQRSVKIAQLKRTLNDFLGQTHLRATKENSRRRSRRFQFPSMWPYTGRNVVRGLLIPGRQTARRGAAPHRCCRCSPRLNWKQTCIAAEKGGNVTVIPPRCATRADNDVSRSADGSPTRFYSAGSRKTRVSNPYVQMARTPLERDFVWSLYLSAPHVLADPHTSEFFRFQRTLLSHFLHDGELPRAEVGSKKFPHNWFQAWDARTKFAMKTRFIYTYVKYDFQHCNILRLLFTVVYTCLFV